MNLNSFMPVHLVTGAGCVRSSAKVLSGLGSRFYSPQMAEEKRMARISGWLDAVHKVI